MNEQQNSKMLQALVQFIASNHKDKPAIEELINSTSLLDKHVKTLKIQWHVIAKSINVDRYELYNWYHEIYQKHHEDAKITLQRKEIMHRLMVQGIKNKQIERSNFTRHLQIIIFGFDNQHKIEFQTMFRNIIRRKEIATLLKKKRIMLPNSRVQQGEQIHMLEIDELDPYFANDF